MATREHQNQPTAPEQEEQSAYEGRRPAAGSSVNDDTAERIGHGGRIPAGGADEPELQNRRHEGGGGRKPK